MIKKIPKILTALFLIIFIVELFGFIFILLYPNLLQAQEKIKFVPQVGVGGEFTKGAEVPINDKSIGEYIQEIYKYAIGVVGILAAVVLMVGGIIWLTSGGNQTRVGEAKSWIGASLSGLIIAICSYLILATINIDLVKIKSIKPKEATAMGCCQDTNTTCSIANEDSCKGKFYKGANFSCENGGCINKDTTVSFTPSGNGCCEYEEEVVGINLDKCSNKNTLIECNAVCTGGNGKYVNCAYSENKRCSQKTDAYNNISDTQPCVNK